ncbi:ABC transporter permease subunit [Senegalia massiliensis]|uniref:ABC transporter permease subunit n=1 Tax=Senegalia massiliensis TaxID=1720316 RepID=UPI00103095D8|nr:ABC transporter permease subunit [Senegalia massiliensis]
MKKYRNIILKFIRNIILVLSALTFIIFLIKIPVTSEFNIDIKNISINTNINFKEILNEIFDYYKMIFSGTFGKTSDNRMVWSYIRPGINRSIVLLSISLILAIILGILKGIYDSKNDKPYKSSIKILSTLALIAMPNVFLILLLQFLAVILYRNGIDLVPAAGYGEIRHMILPILALTLIPMSYIARITSLSIDEAYTKEYVETARGKGANDRRILTIHIIRNSIIDILDSFSSITTIIISTLLIVEYMFAYPGIAYMMFRKSGEDNIIIAIAIIIGVLYFFITSIFKIIKHILDPKLKEENI